MAKQLAIMSDIHFGMRDAGKPCIWFTVAVMEGWRSLQIISSHEPIEKFIREADCYKLEDLEGKPCIVDIENMSCKFVEVFKP